MQENKPTEPLVTTNHLRRMGLCATGSKGVATKLLGEAGWRKLARHGIPISELTHVKHPDILQLIEMAKADFEAGK